MRDLGEEESRMPVMRCGFVDTGSSGAVVCPDTNLFEDEMGLGTAWGVSAEWGTLNDPMPLCRKHYGVYQEHVRDTVKSRVGEKMLDDSTFWEAARDYMESHAPVNWECDHESSLVEGLPFCRDCGNNLINVCPSCGERVRSVDQFCGACGHFLNEIPLTGRELED